MASLIVGGIGAGIGAMYGNPMLGFSIGMSLGGVLFPPESPTQQRGKLDDLRIGGSSYGAAIPRLYGCNRIAGNVIWATPKLTEHEHRSSGGGKGGGSQTVTDYSYSWSFLVLLSERMKHGETIRRIWCQDKLIYDAEATPTTKATIRFYDGTPGQGVDPFISAHIAANPTLYDVAASPEYNECDTVLFEEFDLSPFGNSASAVSSLSFETYAAGGVKLRDILYDLGEACGLASDEMEFCAAMASVQGFMVAGRQSVRETWAPLLKVCKTDIAEFDFALRAIPRGCDVPVEIAEADLGAHLWSGSDDPVTPYSLTREDDLSLPKRLDVTFFSFSGVGVDPDTLVANRPLYEQGNQFALRHSKEGQADSQTLSFPLTMLVDKGRQTAEFLLYDAWLARIAAQIALGPRYLRIVAGSVLQATLGPRTYRLRVIQSDVGVFSEMRISAVPDRESVITQPAPGGANTGPGGGEISVTSPIPVTFRVWSGIDIRDTDTLTPHFYLAGTWASGGTGGSIYYSSDGGASYVLAGTVSKRSMIGVTTSGLADGTVADAWDAGATVDLDLDSMADPETATHEEVENGANAMLIGDELAGYSVVSGTVTISDLLRGRRATSMVGHASGERAISVSSALERINVRESLIGVTLGVKVVASGQTLADVTAQTVTIAQNYPVYAPIESAKRNLSYQIPIGTLSATGVIDDIDLRLPQLTDVVVTWGLVRAVLRAETPGATDPTTILLESSPPGGAFTPTTLDTLTLPATDYEAEFTSSLGVVSSDTLLRLNVSAYAPDALNLTLALEFTEQ